MRMSVALVALFLCLGPSAALAQESCEITAGGTPAVTFQDGGDTATQSGSIELLCTADLAPSVTVSGNGSGAGYDFSGTLLKGTDQIPFTGTWDARPPAIGGTPILWTFTATATDLFAARPGSYSATLTFTITP